MESFRFTPAERAIIRRHRTPRQVQGWLRRLPYNMNERCDTLRTFRSVVRTGKAHCLEAALSAAMILDQHGYPPLLLDLESQDNLDHVLFLFRGRQGWGSVGRSRDPGLHGRRAVFPTVRDLVYSYVDPFVDFTGRITGYGVFDLRALDGAGIDWRTGRGDVWEIESTLIKMPHKPLRSSNTRYKKWLRQYRAYRAKHGEKKPVYYPGKARWM